MTLLPKNQLMKINMSVWITENYNILSYDYVIANEGYVFPKAVWANLFINVTPVVSQRMAAL